MRIIEHDWKWALPLFPRTAASRKTVVIHHAAAKTASPEDIDRWHKARGWAGIAYHFVVRKDGSVHRGRPYSKRGGHTKGHNSLTGICLEGNFMSEKPTEAQLESLRQLLRELHAAEGGVVVKRHKDLSPTSCPGTHFPWPFEYGDRPAPAPKPAEKPASKPKSREAMSLVKLGSKGFTVVVLQTALREKGYDIKVDGIFGRKTLAAVKAYQKRCRMAVDGIVGEKTWAALGYRFKR